MCRGNMLLAHIHIPVYRWIAWIALVLVGNPLTAQYPDRPPGSASVTFEHIGEEQGINRVISCIFEDHLGYLWFGAGPEGLYRFDGYEFEHYEYLVGDTTSLPHNIVADILYEDRSGNLWLICGGTIARYNRATNDFSWFHRLNKELSYDTWAYINSVTEDRDGNIWLASYGHPANPQSGGLIMINADSDQMIYYRHDPADSSSLACNCLSNLLLDDDGVLWVGTCGMGVDRLIPSTINRPAGFAHYRHRLEDPADFINTTIREMIDDGAGSLWFNEASGGLLKYSKKKDVIRRYLLEMDPGDPMNRITVLAADQEGCVWIGTGGGLARYDPGKDGFIKYKPDSNDPFSIPGGAVRDLDFGKDGSLWVILGDENSDCMLTRLDPLTGKFSSFFHRVEEPFGLSSPKPKSALVDRNGILWIATDGEGINKYDPNKLKFNSLYANNLDGEGAYPEDILALCMDQRNRLWIGTDGKGLYSYDRNTGNTRAYPYEASDPGTVKSRRIYSIIEHPGGILWIGGDSGLNRLDTRNLDLAHFWPDPEKQTYYGPNFIRDLYPDAEGNIWIATMHGGLVCFHMESGTFSFHRKSGMNPGGVPATGLMTVCVDDSGTVWTGSLGGLHKYKPGKPGEPSSNTVYQHDPVNPHTIGADMVGDLIFDKSGTLWAAAGGGGLNKMDGASGAFITYTTREGLLSNTITSMCLDSHGKLWLGSFSGLGKFDPVTGQCVVYDCSDGLSSREIRQGSGTKSSGGEIFFAGPGGINNFHPDSLPLNDYIPPVVITRMYLFEQPLLQPISEGNVELKHNENFLTFEFAALNFTNSHKNQYRYRMIGLDPDTVFAGSRRSATYTDMKPGTYTFWVTGSNNDGIWNPQGSSLEILIHPPWSQTGLAIGLYMLLFIFGVLGIIRWRTLKLVKDRRNLELQVKERISDIEARDKHILEMDRMKTRFFANISHEFRTPLTLIINTLDEIVSKRKQKDPELTKLGIIQRNSQRLLSLVNQLLDLSKLDSGKLKLELVEADVVRRLKLTCASFISLAEKKRIRYAYHLPRREYVTCFDAGKLDTIMINLLSNAFKYTPMEGIVDCYARIEGPQAESGGQQDPVRLTVSVIDSGPGIDPEKQRHIFDRFYQGDQAHQTEGGGTGIGLSLTKELVELLHGEISVNSEPGNGSSFTVSMPLGKEHLKESEYFIREEKKVDETKFSPRELHSISGEGSDSENEESAAFANKESIHLLIVEDHDDLRNYLREQLQNGFTIIEAASGHNGLKQALKYIPDLIITDLMMPGMNGMDLCRQLKSNERTSHIPVIMLTAKADMDSKISGLQTGADDYILKPFQIRELRTRIDNLIRQRNLLRKRYSANVDIIADDILLNSHDVNFVRRITEVVQDHLSDFEFDVSRLQEKSGLSSTQLYRKLYALTGMSPSKFIRRMRLKQALKLLEQDRLSVTQVAFEVGFGNLSYFTKCFKEQFGILPSEYSIKTK